MSTAVHAQASTGDTLTVTRQETSTVTITREVAVSDLLPGDLIRERNIDWTKKGYSSMVEMTCLNHPRARYLTKGPGRNLHFVEADPDFVRAKLVTEGDTKRAALSDEILAMVARECPCSSADLRVVVDAELIELGLVEVV